MDIPSWLAHLTGANAFAADPIAAILGDSKPTLGDAFQGIGHSLMENGRSSFGNGPARPGVAAAPSMGALAHGITSPAGAPALGKVPGITAHSLPPVVQPPPGTGFTPMPQLTLQQALANLWGPK